ncbi:MAG: NAD(P)/FAD-dependent oxidoreductase [Bacteroidetes bacterium]|nr:NAD(P)/FAD-dependent oxidoreductase [Bacteroidota bacterium]
MSQGNSGNNVLIIGSGLGGLLCGAILSKEGFRVTVLEKNSVIGGCLQTFTRQGKTFDTGMHYIGSMEKGQILHTIFSYVGLTRKLRLKQLDIDCFDRISYMGKEYDLAQGFERFTDSLSARFPGKKDEISQYVKGLRKVVGMVDLYNLRPFRQENLFVNPGISIPASEYIAGLTKDNVLRNILAGLNGLYAGVKEGSPLYVHAVINHFFIQSAWRPIGGSSQIAAALSEIIETNGGEIIPRAEVQILHVDGDLIDKVITTDGREFHSEYIISDIHPANTLRMLNGRSLRKAYINRVLKLENSMGMFILYIILKKDCFPYLNHNYYYFDKDDVWSDQNQDDDKWPSGFMMYTSARLMEQQYSENVVVMTYMKYDQVRPWENTTVGKRGEAYEEFKAERAERLMDLVEKAFPGIRQKVERIYTSTPLTFRDYTGTIDGSAYGIIKDSRNFMDSFLIPRTKIPNLYLTGQNLNLHGILGVSLSALITCAEFVGQEYLLKKVHDAV